MPFDSSIENESADHIGNIIGSDIARFQARNQAKREV